MLKAIEKLRSLPVGQKDCAVHFNITLARRIHMQNPGCNEDDHYGHLLEMINWFMFDLLILGYIEDPNSGVSFTLQQWLNWTFYIELPCQCLSDEENTMLHHFKEDYPILGLTGLPFLVSDQTPLSVTKEVQLVCKYLTAYEDGRIDRLYDESKFKVELLYAILYAIFM